MIPTSITTLQGLKYHHYIITYEEARRKKNNRELMMQASDHTVEVVKYSGRPMMMEFSLLLHVRTSADFAAVNKSPSSRM